MREILGRNHPQGEPAVDQFGGQPFGRPDAALHDLAEADLADVGHALVDAGEGAALEQVGRVDGVPGPAELVGERDHAGSQPLGVVEEQDFGHTSAPGMLWAVRAVQDKSRSGGIG